MRPLQVVAVAGFGVGCATAAVSMPASSPSPLYGRAAPAIDRPILQGGRFASGAVAGRLVVYEFFARYCVPCRDRLERARELARELPDVLVVGVALDPTVEAALAAVRVHQLGFPVIHDAGSVLAGRFRVTELPLAMVVDRQGRVAFVSGPEQPPEALRQAVLALRR
jgi:thiol-disulfide isomerase/thioredoxin